jgi:hypothetical protein
MILRRLVLPCVLALGAVAWIPAAAHGGQDTVDCPADAAPLCVCWREDGVLGMACPQETTATGAIRRRENRPAHAGRAERRAEGDAATAESDDALGATDDERHAALLSRQERLTEQLLKVQRERFLARMRPEPDPAEVERLDQAFDGAQKQRLDNLRRLQAFEARR